MLIWLEDFTAFLKRNGKLKDMNAPAAQVAIDAVENELHVQERVRGFRFPPSYHAFLARWDGGYFADSDDDINGYGSYVSFYSIDPEPSYNSLASNNARDSVFMNHEIETYWGFEPLVVFAQDEGGSPWAFDPRQFRPDGEMPVLYLNHETGETFDQAKDFAEFIEKLTTRTLSYRGLGYED
jgi:hypothetical protein